MSRKVIRDFIRQADSLDSSQATAYFETIMEVYEDSVHTAAERVATLESDTLWLLGEYRKIVEAKDNSPEEKQKHRIAQSNLGQMLSILIASTADKGIYLSEAFIMKYDKVEFVGSEFGKYVRESYSVRKCEPQQKPSEIAGGQLAGNSNETRLEALQQPIEGNGGELAGNGNKMRPDESPEADKVQYINLPLGMQTPDKRAEKIFKSAIDNGWMAADENQGTWYGFDETKDGKAKNYAQSLAYLCGKTYNLSDTNQTQNWGIVEKYFRVQELSKHWGNVIGYERKSGRKQSYQIQIDTLISKALKTP